MAGMAAWQNVDALAALEKGRQPGTGKIKNETLYWVMKSRYKPDELPPNEQPSLVVSTNQVDFSMLLAICHFWRKQEWQAIENNSSVLESALPMLTTPNVNHVWKSFKDLYVKESTSELAIYFILEVAFVLFRGNPNEFLGIAQRVSQNVSVSKERKTALEHDMGHRGMPRGKAAPKIKEDTPQEQSADSPSLPWSSDPNSPDEELEQSLPLRAFPDDLAPRYGAMEVEAVSVGSDEIFVKSEPPLVHEPQLPLPPNNTNGQYSDQQYAAAFNNYQGSSSFLQRGMVGSSDGFVLPSDLYDNMQSPLLTNNDAVAPQVLYPLPTNPVIPQTNFQFFSQAAHFALDPAGQTDQVQFSTTTVADGNPMKYGVINPDLLSNTRRWRFQSTLPSHRSHQNHQDLTPAGSAGSVDSRKRQQCRARPVLFR